MDANPLTPRDLFDGTDHYEIPAFQRPYVWNREDQWQPLWDDIVRVAESVTVALDSDTEPEVPHHFLGAVVYVSHAPRAGGVVRHDVIDGQQRMTTLQILIDAVHAVLDTDGFSDDAEDLESLILNRSSRFKGTIERFKLWPSQTDRDAFVQAMDPNSDAKTDENHQISKSHAFFFAEARSWIDGEPDEDGEVPPGDKAARARALASSLQDRLILVAIDLTGHDDSQLIFETLNDRGTPLLKADLIKNWVFREGEKVHADVARWAESYWAEFDTSWWREEIRQGRLQRSRIDIFLQYWLTMRLSEEVRVENVFRDFVAYAQERLTSAESAEILLKELRADADTYRAFAQLDEQTPEGRFYKRVIEVLELASITPVFLWLLSENHNVPPEQRREALAALESWAIRRTLLQMTTKDINKFMIYLLRGLNEVSAEDAGKLIFSVLSSQTSDSRIWPSDSELFETLAESKIYGNIRQSRIRLVLGEVELKKRAKSEKIEQMKLPEKLEVEHVMPRGWRTFWDSEPRLSPDEAAKRDRLVHTIGNLTLITKSLNGSLSNRPWTDQSAEGLREGGEPEKGKRSLLSKYSLLAMNKEIIDNHVEVWRDEDIRSRSQSLIGDIVLVWPGPDLSIQNEALSFDEASDDSVSAAWSATEAEAVAARAGETIKLVLDTLAQDESRAWSNADFKEAGLTDKAYAALGALTMMVKYRLSRTDSPVIYMKRSNTVYWRINPSFSARWRELRGLGPVG